MVNLPAIELKFLLKLIGQPEYRAAIATLQPNSATKAAERDAICKRLCAQGLVAYEAEVKSFSIAPPGKALLTLDPTNLPLSTEELRILQTCAIGQATPGQLKKINKDQRQTLIDTLAQKGLLTISKSQIKQVWLTTQGKIFLRDECDPGGSSTLSLSLLGNYLKFMRQMTQPVTNQPLAKSGLADKPNADAVLQCILELDQALNTDHYLPIFHLRDKLQPPLSRDELDELLYQLQREDRIDLSTVQEERLYTVEQLNAGIHSVVGAPLFFIRIKF